jgi:hypothetical protein
METMRLELKEKHRLVNLSTRKYRSTYSKWCEEPLVFARGVPLLQLLLNVLFGVLPLRGLFEGVVGDSALQTLKLKLVSRREKVGVVDDL